MEIWKHSLQHIIYETIPGFGASLFISLEIVFAQFYIGKNPGSAGTGTSEYIGCFCIFISSVEGEREQWLLCYMLFNLHNKMLWPFSLNPIFPKLHPPDII